MNLNERLIQALDQHQKYLQTITDHIHKLTEFNRDELATYAKDMQAEKYRNYLHLVLILGYTVYFATWYQLREIFIKCLMGWSYGFMVFSLFVTILSLTVPYFIKLIKNDYNYKAGYVRNFDLVALIFGSISILLIGWASIVWLFKYME